MLRRLHSLVWGKYKMSGFENAAVKSAQCPFHNHNSAAPVTAPGPRLMRASEVERNYASDSPLVTMLNWVKGFLAKPHPDVGRKGPVCPFVPISLVLDSIWFAEITDSRADLNSIAQIITEYRDRFLEMEPKNGSEAMNKAILVVFPNLGAEGAAVVDEVQFNLKKFFVDLGLMLGEFHATNESPGLRNPSFRPLRSPIPMLAIRYMVESDLPFLLRSMYAPSDRSSFLRSYLRRMGSSMSQSNFDQTMAALIEAELQIHSAEHGMAELAEISRNVCASCANPLPLGAAQLSFKSVNDEA